MFRTTIKPFALSAILLAAACGGSDKPEPKAPETEPVASAAPADLPPPPATAAVEPAPAPAPAPEPVKLDVAAAKFTPAKTAKNAKAFEVKADGTVQSGGKPVLKVSGDHLEDATGKTVLTVGTDGTLTGADYKSGFKFQGDDIVSEDGAKVSVAEDGTVNGTFNKKTDTLGKFDSASAKKTAALVSFVLLAPKDAVKAAPAAPEGKAAGKDKPAGKDAAPAAGGSKDAAKPAPAKK